MFTKRELRRPSLGSPLKPIVIRRRPEKGYAKTAAAVRGPRGEEIFRFREATCHTRAEFARLMGVSEQSIFNWESGRMEPKGLAWRSFCQVRKSLQSKLRLRGIEIDGGPLMNSSDL